MSRLAGIALIGLGVACWPGTDTRQASYGMVTYSVLAMLYLFTSACAVNRSGCCRGQVLWCTLSSRSFSVGSGSSHERTDQRNNPDGLQKTNLMPRVDSFCQFHQCYLRE